MAAVIENSIDPSADWGSPAQREALAKPLRERARVALQSADPRGAMVLASDALMLTPNAPESLALVDGLLRGSSAPLELVPLSVSVALTACRARALALQGDLSWALTLLRHVVSAAPSLPCMSWLSEWLTPESIRRIGLAELKSPLVALVKLWSNVPLGAPTDPRLPNVRATARAIAAVRHELPDQAPLYWAELVLRRRLNDPEITSDFANAAAERFPDDWAVLVSALGAERDAKHPDAALGYARRALQLSRADGSPLHDAALAYAEAGRATDARKLLRELLDAFPDYQLSEAAQRLLER